MAKGVYERLFGRKPGGVARLEIDGVIHEAVGDVTIDDDRLLVGGREVGGRAGRIVTVRILDGTLDHLSCSGDVEAIGVVVAGDVEARGDVRCGDVGGSVKSDKDVHCGNVRGGIVAGRDVIGANGRG